MPEGLVENVPAEFAGVDLAWKDKGANADKGGS